MGFATNYGGFRTVQVQWKGPDGRYSSFSKVGSFMLTSAKFSETNVLSVFHDVASGRDVTYDVSARPATTPVSSTDGRLQIQLPNEPRVVVEGNKMTATIPDVFIDYWERID